MQGGQVQLALLHPMKVSVYTLTTIEGTTVHGNSKSMHLQPDTIFLRRTINCTGNQNQLELCHEYKLRAFALSMCKGRFGGVKGKEFICVSQINGSLSVFEQDGIIYESTLAKAAERGIPTVFCYVQRIDSFVTVSASLELECYSYQDLVQRSSDQGSAQKLGSIEATWSCCVGEFALDIDALQITK